MWNGCKYGRHAEIDAMLKLHSKKNDDNKKKKKINLIVIRILKNGKLKNSRPCSNCLNHLQRMKYYKIKKVYYSSDEGNIIMEKFMDLINSNKQHISRRFRKNDKRFFNLLTQNT